MRSEPPVVLPGAALVGISIYGPMLESLLDGLKAAGASLERAVLHQGAKVQGVHLGPVYAPFYKDDVRHIPPNLDNTQEDTLRRSDGEQNAKSPRDPPAWRPAIIGRSYAVPYRTDLVLLLLAFLADRALSIEDAGAYDGRRLRVIQILRKWRAPSTVQHSSEGFRSGRPTRRGELPWLSR